jgi:hypothetical protein
MTKFQNKSVWVIRDWNLDIVWDLVLEIWCLKTNPVSLPFKMLGTY